MFDSRLIGLILVFAPLSLLSFGGGQAIMADVKYQTVDVYGWLSDGQFTDLFAISRASPGPGTLIAALIGWQVDSLAGALVAVLAIYIPSSLVVYFVCSWWKRNKDSRWRGPLERGLAPVAVGLIFAGSFAVMRAAHVDLLGLAAVAIATTALYFTKISQYLLMAALALLYTAGHYI